KNDNNTCYVIFKENGSTVQFDLSDMKGPEPAVAVDTKQSYTETKLGVLKPVDQKIVLPYLSDWAITIGDFSYK
ncbi:MAG: hypothetical protein U9N45_08010, partial [Gemmatimonadota bacterium]|nr:hypothetical protein [Gemmatimonadota bacterium]